MQQCKLRSSFQVNILYVLQLVQAEFPPPPHTHTFLYTHIHTFLALTGFGWNRSDGKLEVQWDVQANIDKAKSRVEEQQQVDEYVDQSDDDLDLSVIHEEEEEEDGLAVDDDELEGIMQFLFGDSDLSCMYAVVQCL